MRRLERAGAVTLLLALAACAQTATTASVAVPAVPAGEARVWIYRDAGTYDSHARPYVRMNNAIVGISEPRGAFYRDVPPGHYHIDVDSYLTGDFNQTKDVALAPGQQAYFKVVASEHNCGGGVGGGDGGGGGGDCQRANFYVWEIPPEVAQGDVARTPYFGGS
jgi:hypothetical protein